MHNCHPGQWEMIPFLALEIEKLFLKQMAHNFPETWLQMFGSTVQIKAVKNYFNN